MLACFLWALHVELTLGGACSSPDLLFLARSGNDEARVLWESRPRCSPVGTGSAVLEVWKGGSHRHEVR